MQHDRSGEYPTQIIKQAWELGLVSLALPRVEHEWFGLAMCWSVCGCVEGIVLFMSFHQVNTHIPQQFGGLGPTPPLLNHHPQPQKQLHPKTRTKP